MLQTPSQARCTFPSHSHHHRKLPTHPGAHHNSSAGYPIGIGMPPPATTRAQSETASCTQHQHMPGLAPLLTQLEQGNSEKARLQETACRTALRHTHCSPTAPSRVREAVSSYSQGKTIPAHGKNRPRLSLGKDDTDTIFCKTRKRSMACP